MRSLAAFGLSVGLAAVAAAVDYSGVNYGADTRWSYQPDKTADWYKEHREPLPELAPTLTVVEENKSYIVKLECVGCPFRVREKALAHETWYLATDNSLLLNLTIDESEPGLLLNGARIAPLAPMPLGISAFQTPANLSKDIMGKMASMHMLDDATWKIGTKYETFWLQYEHTLLATGQPGEEWVQFDVTGVHIKSGPNTGSASLDKEGQKMIQLLLREEVSDNKHTFSIKDIQIVERKDRAQPIKMKCGKFAMIKTEYNPMEWDGFGKFGTWSRAWNLFLENSGNFLVSKGLALIIVCIVFAGIALVRRHIRRQKIQALALIEDDVEAALLAPEHEDAPPEYSDASQVIEEKEDNQ